jgi:regulator of chromosome condensation
MPPKKRNADPAPVASAAKTTTKPAAKAVSKPATTGRGRPKKTDTESAPETTKTSVKKVTKKATKESAPAAAAAGASKTKAQPKKQPAKKTAATATTKATTTMSTTGSKKRKAEEAEEEKPRAPKKPRVIREPKPKVVKAAAPKVVINEVPTTRLNVFVCGEGSSGELGLGAAKAAIDVKRPRLNKFLDAHEVGVVQIAVGGMHCLALTHDNKILTWGVNDQGALGRDTTWDGGYKEIKEDAGSGSDSDEEDDDSGLNPRESTPTAIPSSAFPEETVFVAVAAADSASFALTDDGQVWGWGTFRVS